MDQFLDFWETKNMISVRNYFDYLSEAKLDSVKIILFTELFWVIIWNFQISPYYVENDPYYVY